MADDFNTCDSGGGSGLPSTFGAYISEAVSLTVLAANSLIIDWAINTGDDADGSLAWDDVGKLITFATAGIYHVSGYTVFTPATGDIGERVMDVKVFGSISSPSEYWAESSIGAGLVGRWSPDGTLDGNTDRPRTKITVNGIMYMPAGSSIQVKVYNYDPIADASIYDVELAIKKLD
jgi:hypothetical protein